MRGTSVRVTASEMYAALANKVRAKSSRSIARAFSWNSQPCASICPTFESCGSVNPPDAGYRRGTNASVVRRSQ